MFKIFKAGFLVGFGTCLILIGTSPILLMLLGVELHPSHPGSKTLFGLLDWVKANKFLYVGLKTLFSYATRVYQYIIASTEARFMIIGVILAGGAMVVYGIEMLRRK